MPAHIKAALTATSLAIPIERSKLALGTWQGIYLWEHRRRGSRRELVVHIGMRTSSDIVGREVGPDEQILDERWLMAYNAAFGKVELEPHPLFPVCYEWPATRLLRERAGLVPLDARLVHAQRRPASARGNRGPGAYASQGRS